MKKIFLLFFLSFICLNLPAQNLTLTNGIKEKTFKPGGFYSLKIAMGDIQKGERCCEFINVTGHLATVTSDSVHMLLSSYHYKNLKEESGVENKRIFSNGNFAPYNFAKQDISILLHYNKQKNLTRKKLLGSSGGLLLFTGLTTALNMFVVTKRNGRADLFKSASIQAGAGAVFLIIGNSKKYRFKGQGNNLWHIK